jgi:hypothetical protein
MKTQEGKKKFKNSEGCERLSGATTSSRRTGGVRQSVLCVHSVGLGSCWFVRVLFFADSHVSTFYIFLYGLRVT